METIDKPLIVIVGETASGKSRLGVELAHRFKGEIICADATTVYKDFDIGTAKPTSDEMQGVPHHLLDITTAKHGFSAPDFQAAALEKMEDIWQRGALPILVGGTGLYIDSVLYAYSFLHESDPEVREKLNAMELTELLSTAESRGLDTTGLDIRNKRRVIRHIENNGAIPTKQNLRKNTLVLGMKVATDDLTARIEQRVDRMLGKGLEAEVQKLSKTYGWSCEPMKAIGYREWREYFEGTQNLNITVERIISSTKRLAKKQRTWFKRNNSIQWVTNSSEAVVITTTFLNKSISETS